jgi:hypothetical protein
MDLASRIFEKGLQWFGEETEYIFGVLDICKRRKQLSGFCAVEEITGLTMAAGGRASFERVIGILSATLSPTQETKQESYVLDAAGGDLPVEHLSHQLWNELNTLYTANSSFLLSKCFLSLSTSDLTGCSFRLKAFGLRSGSLPLLEIIPFLTEQCEITRSTPPATHPPHPCPPNAVAKETIIFPPAVLVMHRENSALDRLFIFRLISLPFDIRFDWLIFLRN